MRLAFGRLVLLLVCLSLCDARAVAGQQGTLVGTVVDAATRAPLVSAQVSVVGPGVSVGSLTNEAGRFTISAAAGRYAVEIVLIGYAAHRLESVTVGAGEVANLGTIPLAQTALSLDQLVISVTPGGNTERALEAPSHVEVINQRVLEDRVVTTPVEHLRNTPGVDIIQHGVQATNVVVRGFNNIFSGALHALTDHRLAGVPSLRVNLLHFIPSVPEDIQRMEVVLGPGSALYGPNVANGVLHILTKSPLTHQGTTVTVAGGEQSVFMTSFRSAHLLGDDFGIKLSGQYVTGDEWMFDDPAEVTNRQLALADPQGFRAEVLRRGFSAEEADEALGLVGNRDFSLQRFSGELRADWAFDEDGTLVLTSGVTSSSGIELTGIGAGQTRDWIYSFYQARVSKGRFFAQGYVNASDAGDSYLLRDGVPLVDESKLFVTQVQHGFELAEERQQFTYGVDFFKTSPETRGTINGENEDSDDMEEWGAYLQSETALSDQFDLVLAGRLDSHSMLEDDVFSPRAALVFKPDEAQSLRFTYNRAFSTPSALNFFLDISAGPFPEPNLAALGYRLRAQGLSHVGDNTGFTFINPDGSLAGMRSPFTPAILGGPGQLLPADPSVMWPLAVGAAAGIAAQRGTPIDPTLIQFLLGLQPTSDDIGIMVLDANNPTNPDGSTRLLPLASAGIQNVPGIEESRSTTYEVGYTGVLDGRLRLAADVWYSERKNFVSPLVLTTPFLLLNGQDIAAFAGPPLVSDIAGKLIAAGVPQDQAVQQAQQQAGQILAQLVPAVAGVPVGVVSSPEVDASGADAVVTYVNVGSVDLWGADFALQWDVDDLWSVKASASFVSDDYFEIEDGAPIAFNAPTFKGSAALAYRNRGFNAEGRVRHIAEYPAVSAGFVGTECIEGVTGGGIVEPCVEAKTLVDLTLGYRVPNTQATVQLTVSDLFDTGYKSFPGTPEIGRFGLVRVKYNLF